METDRTRVRVCPGARARVRACARARVRACARARARARTHAHPHDAISYDKVSSVKQFINFTLSGGNSPLNTRTCSGQSPNKSRFSVCTPGAYLFNCGLRTALKLQRKLGPPLFSLQRASTTIHRELNIIYIYIYIYTYIYQIYIYIYIYKQLYHREVSILGPPCFQ